MAVTEESRNRLYRRLAEALGSEEATTLMELVPPVGWADVATKRDLDALEERMTLRFDGKLDVLRLELERGLRGVEQQMRQQLYWLLGFMMTTILVVVGLLQFA